MDFACGEDHIWGGRCGFFLAAFHALRQPVQVTGWHGALFYLWRGVNEYESEIHLPGCGTPLGYKGLCWNCKCEQERTAALAWTPQQIAEKQRNLIQNIRRLGDMEDRSSPTSGSC